MYFKCVFCEVLVLCVLFLSCLLRVSLTENVNKTQDMLFNGKKDKNAVVDNGFNNLNLQKISCETSMKKELFEGILKMGKPLNTEVPKSEQRGLSSYTTDFNTNNIHKVGDYNQRSKLGLLQNMFVVFKGCKSDMQCYQKKILSGLDRILYADQIQISDGMILIKEGEISFYREAETDAGPFLPRVVRRLLQILESHALRVKLGVMQDNVEQARIGHHGYRHAFPLMVGSFMLMAAFMVPMGFQFLAVIGGKALVLSQIALVMAMGGTLQRYFGGGGHAATPSNLGGIVQHDYYLRDDLRPWKREGAEEAFTRGGGISKHHPSSALDQQQLQGLMYYQQN